MFRVFSFRLVMLQYLLEYFQVIILTFVVGGQIPGLCFVVFQNRRFAQGLGIVHYLISSLCSTNEFFPDAFAALLVISGDSHLSPSLALYFILVLGFVLFNLELCLHDMLDLVFYG